MSKSARPDRQAARDTLEQRLQALMQQEASRLADWSAQREQPPTLGELEQGVLGALRRLGPQLLEGLLAEETNEAEEASLSPPLRLRSADESDRASPQTDADAVG